MVTNAPFLSAGNQSIRRTIQGLVERGFEIELWLLGVDTSAGVPEKIKVKCFTIPIFVRSLLKLLLSLFPRSHSIKEPRRLDQILDYHNDEVNQWLASIPATLFFSIVLIVHYLKYYKSLRNDTTQVIWGYERGGILPAKVISWLFGVPLITSFQGTVLNFYLKYHGVWKAFVKLPLDFIATWMKADLVIMTDDGTGGIEVLQRFGHKRSNILFIPNGVDLAELATVKPAPKHSLRLSEEEILFVVSARLVAHKRIDRALRLAKALQDDGIDNFKLFIIGGGSDQDYLLDLATKLGLLNKRVFFLGELPYKKTLSIIAAADMIWSFQDGSNLNNTVQDALALGKYVLTLDDDSLRGFLVRSPAISAELILRLPLDRFLETGIEIVQSWVKKHKGTKGSNSLKVTEGVWSWESRLDMISTRIRSLVTNKAREHRYRFYDVILTSSNAIAPFPRLENAANCLSGMGLCCLAIGWDREARYPRIEVKGSGNINIIRAHFRGRFGGGIRNIPGFLQWNLWLLYKHVKLRPEIIHAYDFDTALPALIAKILTGCKVVYDIADWYANSRRVSFFSPLIERIERWVCRRVDLVILAHEKRLDQVGFLPRKWVIIYNSPHDVYKNLQLTKTEVMGSDFFAYVGVLQPDRGLEQIVEAVKAIGAKLILAGFGPLETYCRKVTATTTNIKFLGQIPYERTLAIEGNATAIIALYDPKLPNNRLAAPNKLYEAMMLGRPLVTTKGTLVGQLVEKERIGITVNYGNIQELSQALRYLINNPKECEEMGHRARMLYETRYSFSKQCEKIRQAYKELCPKLFTECSESEG